MISRQRAILRLIDNEGGSVSRLRLVKLAFLLSKIFGAPAAATYDFVPYKWGPFSFTLYHELRSLERDGWLAAVENEVKLLEAPHLETAALDREFLASIDETSRRYRSIATPALMDNVYHQYPWFTLNSEILHKRAMRRPACPIGVYTVGYEGIMVDALLDLLLRKGIRRLIDVRSNPVARRYGFHKGTLSRLCKDVEIDYVHLASLGVPSQWRADLSDAESYERLLERYEREILPKRGTAIDNVGKLISETPSALMCMEANHHYCHRSRLSAEVSRRISLPTAELREV
jgi:uncharacterized protein (DUF488 family)